MTERGHGVPDSAEPSSCGDARTPTGPPPGMVPPADLDAVRRTDAIIDALAARRAAGSASLSLPGGETGRRWQVEESDPAVRLLRALIDDVDDPGQDAGPDTTPPTPPATPPTPSGPEPDPDSGSGPGPRRRGPRTIVALGVAGAVLASTGVAAAGGVHGRPPAAAPAVGESGGARTTAPADTDAGTYRPRPPARLRTGPARPAPAPTPAPTSTSSPEREDEPRVYFPFPFGSRFRPERPFLRTDESRPPATGSPDGVHRRSPGELRRPARPYPSGDGYDSRRRHRHRE